MRWKGYWFAILILGDPGLFLKAPLWAGQPVKESIKAWCDELEKEIRSWKGWASMGRCVDLPWKEAGHSVRGRALVYASFETANLEGALPIERSFQGALSTLRPALKKNTTLIFSMVHGDEGTPLFIALQLAFLLQEQRHTPQASWLRPGHQVVIAPLINPDGFYHRPRRLRVNARGVDLNRNFETLDWFKGLEDWKRRGRPPRRFPGWAPVSEPETVFQRELIREFQPKIILSLHSPLDYLDMVGPGHAPQKGRPLADFIPPRGVWEQHEKLRQHLKAMVGDFFPGSLGNYAGKQLGIPTFTLELPSSDPHRAPAYWKRYHSGIQALIHYPLDTNPLDSLD